MQDSEQLLGYLQQGIDTLLKQKSFDGGQEFRRTQKQALQAYKRYLSNDGYITAEKLKGFFEIPTGVGKTAVFVGIVAAAHKAAEENGEELKTAIVVPTVQLLEQTVESLADFAPWMKDSIGIYGDGKKNLKLPFTVLTYDAFVELTEAGKLSSDNVDILISDEAHRGTSERRVENITGTFNENTVQLAFTATAHFNEEKSVENSHKREIFYKSVKDAIKEGELAAYVSSQRYIIRVDPDEFMLSDKFQEASDERRIKYRRAAKQNAWNKRMVTIFREGRDEKTGDLLTDNQAGFFVEGTKQADKLEDLLNGDIELVKRAEEQGYEGVAVAIHSKLTKTEQKRRYKDYKDGKYLAVIGDEMFKEGFDHPPMKTLFDCPHSSVVDKAQILGRGLRKWWNELKDRYEGLTIIDTVMYFGDENPDVQGMNRDRALMNTISVKQVLESSELENDDYFNGAPSGGGRPSGGGGSLFDDDPDVEEYTSLEDLYELEEEIDKLNEVERLRQEALWKNNPLTLADIKATIEAYRKENNLENPSAKGEIIEYGPLKDRAKWFMLNYAIMSGGNGLSLDPKYKVFLDTLEPNEIPTLSKLYIYYGFSEKRWKLTMSSIKETIEAYRKLNDGSLPTEDSGKISCGPLSGNRTWKALSAAIHNGNISLVKDPDYQKFLKSLGVKERASLANIRVFFGFQNKSVGHHLTMQDIKETIKAYKKKHNRNPSERGGDITLGPLKGKYKWKALESAIRYGRYNLPTDAEYIKFISSLSDNQTVGLASLKAYLDFGDNSKKITMADIKATIKFYREKHNKNPSKNCKESILGPLKGRIKWEALNSSIQRGHNGLSDDPEYHEWLKKENKPSLFKLCEIIDTEPHPKARQKIPDRKSGPS